MARHLSRILSPALDDPDGAAEKVENLAAGGGGPAVEQRRQM